MILSLLISSAYGATIAQLVKGNPNLSQIAALIDSNPDLANPNSRGTFFAPTNQALANKVDLNGKDGSFYTKRVVEFAVDRYAILDDVDGKSHIVFDNYEGANLVNPEIHIRFGLGEGKLVNNGGLLKADNGMLYISELAIGSPTLVSKTLPAIGTSSWAKFVADQGLKDFADGLKDCTFFAPNDEALAKFDFSKYSASQRKAFVFYHISPQVTYSARMTTGSLTTLLAGNSIPVRSSSEGADVGDGSVGDTGRFSLADNFASAGVIHRLAFVMVPPSLPSANAPVEPVNVPAGSTSTPKPEGGAATPTPGGNTGSSALQAVTGITSLLVGIIGLLSL